MSVVRAGVAVLVCGAAKFQNTRSVKGMFVLGIRPERIRGKVGPTLIASEALRLPGRQLARSARSLRDFDLGDVFYCLAEKEGQR